MRYIIVFLLLIASANAALNYNTSTYALTTVCNATPDLNITNYGVEQYPLYSDELSRIFVTAINQGNCHTMDNVSIYVDVYSSSLIDVDNCSATSSGPFGPLDSTTLRCTLSPLSPGSYTVNITTIYTVLNFTNLPHIYSNSRNVSFNLTVITRPVVFPPVYYGGGGGGLPSSISTATFVQFQKYPVLQEVAPSSFIIVDLTARNPQNKTQRIKINLSGLPGGWITMMSNDLSMASYETKTFSFTLNVPDNAEAGDYLVKATITDTNINGYSYFVVRVKSYPDNYAAPEFYRKVDLDFINNKSSISVTVKNDAKPHTRVDVYENIPKEIADNVNKVDFTTSPASIVQADPTVMFSMNDLLPEEKRSISYVVNNVIDQYEPYVYWPIEQVHILYEKGVDKIQIANIYQSILVPGAGNDYLTFDIGNIYTQPLNVTVTVWLPSGWKATPDNATLDIPAFQQTNVRIGIYAPPDVNYGAYYGGLYITYENTTISKELVFRIQEVNGLGWFFSIIAALFDNGILLFLLIIAATIVILRRRRHAEGGYEYKEDVYSTLSSIKGVLRRR
jgi:hypothetical protein